MAPSEKDSAFKVIIVGGGFAGLALAHSLERAAGIDWVLLEGSGTCAPEVGASVGFWPHGMRILSQLGCADGIRKVSKLMDTSYARDPTGSPVVTYPLFDHVQERHGFEFRNLARSKALAVLYEQLPDKAKVKLNRRVARLHETDDGVVVSTEDGSIERGHLVVGCDGAYSTTRDLMWKSAEEHGSVISEGERNAFRVEYRCFITMASGLPELETTADMHITTMGPGLTLQLVTQPESTFALVYQKLEQPVVGSRRPRYTQADMDALAATLADKPATQAVTFGDIYAKRLRTSMVNLEEGMFPSWHYGRVAIAGDAAHKTTPNLAFGANSCLEGAASLANALHAAVSTSPAGVPDAAAVDAALAAYQKTHMARMKLISIPAYWSTRMQAWDGVVMRFVANYIFPYLPKTTLATACAPLVARAARLNYLPLAEDLKGTVAWVY